MSPRFGLSVDIAGFIIGLLALIIAFTIVIVTFKRATYPDNKNHYHPMDSMGNAKYITTFSILSPLYISSNLVRQLLESLNQLQGEFLGYEDTGSARQEWQRLWEQGTQLFRELANLSNLSANYAPQQIMQKSELDDLLFRYMNRKYLGL